MPQGQVSLGMCMAAGRNCKAQGKNFLYGPMALFENTAKSKQYSKAQQKNII